MSDNVNGIYPIKNPDWLYSGAVSGSPIPGGKRCNLAVSQLTVDNAAFTTGQINYVAIALQAGDIVNRVSVRVGATAGATLTHFFGALYDPNGNLLAQSTDQQLTAIASGIPANTTAVTALAANTTAHLLLGSQATPTPLYIAATGVHFVAISVTGTTIPSLVGTALATASSQGVVLGTAAASRTSVSPAGLIVIPGSASGVAGSYFEDSPLSMLDASTATGTAPAKIITNGAPTLTAKVPAVWVS